MKQQKLVNGKLEEMTEEEIRETEIKEKSAIKLMELTPERIIEGKEKPFETGYFGNVWVRKLYFADKNSVHEGHKHKHDHISLLTSGSVFVDVEGVVTKFVAPTFIIVRADKEHTITAAEDNTTWWCIFALRDKNGELIDHYEGDNSPYGHVEIY